MSSFASSRSSHRLRIYKEEDLLSYKIKPGSRLVIQRALYEHWAVYIGNGRVCHLTEDRDRSNATSSPTSSAFSSSTINAIVVEESFTDMMGDGDSPVYVDNSADAKWSPLPPADIVKRALSNKGPTTYHVIQGNCEHFVNRCRYGQHKSQQVKDAGTGITVAGIVGVVGAGLLGIFALARSPRN